MNSFVFTDWVRKSCEFFLKHVYLNLLWLLFVLIGCLFLGVAPATVALCAIHKKWLEETFIQSLFIEFWQQFKKHFLKANLLFYLLILMGSIIYFDLYFFIHQESLVFSVLSVIIFVLSIWFMITFVYVFPVYVSFELKWLTTIKYALIIAFLNPVRTILLIFLVWGMTFLSLYYPQILLTVGVSLTIFMVMIVSLQAFHQIEKQREKHS